MGKRGAARTNAGRPVRPSGPGLRVGPTTPATAGRKPEACPPGFGVGVAAGVGVQVELDFGFGSLSQEKRGREPESSALGGASEASVVLRSEATQGGSYLDKEQINRNSDGNCKTYEDVYTTAPVGRVKYCGRATVSCYLPDGSRRFVRVDCRCWGCAYCGPKKASQYKRAIREVAERYGLNRFLTLTLDPKIVGDKDPVAYINAVFAKWRIYLKREFGVSITYIRILEFQKNGNPHFHILVDRFIPQAWIRSTWQAVGGGRFVDIRYVDIHRVSRYLSKYLTKELLLSAPKRSRRVTVSRGIRLIEKKKTDLVWQFFRKKIIDLFLELLPNLEDVWLDEEGVLREFVTKF